MKSRKEYTLEFKQEAIKLVTEQGYSQAEASKRLGIPHANISRWMRELTGNKMTTPKQLTKIMLSSEEQKELEALRKENKRLKMEREILKKAAAFFANESH